MEFKQVKCFSFSRIANAYHTALFSTFRAIINEHGAERLNLPDEIVDEFSDLLDAEQIVVNRSRAKDLKRQRRQLPPFVIVIVIVQILFLFSFKNRGRRNVRK